MKKLIHRTSSTVRNDSIGGKSHDAHHGGENVESLTYVTDESDAWRAMAATEHYRHRGHFWNEGKHQTSQTYILTAVVGMVQALVAYGTNIASAYFIDVRLVLTWYSLGIFNIHSN